MFTAKFVFIVTCISGPQCKLLDYTSNNCATLPHPFYLVFVRRRYYLFHFEPSIQAENGLFFSWDGKYGNFENEDFISVWKGTKVTFFHLCPTLKEAQEVCPTVVGFAGLGRGGLSINLKVVIETLSQGRTRVGIASDSFLLQGEGQHTMVAHWILCMCVCLICRWRLWRGGYRRPTQSYVHKVWSERSWNSSPYVRHWSTYLQFVDWGKSSSCW